MISLPLLISVISVFLTVCTIIAVLIIKRNLLQIIGENYISNNITFELKKSSISSVLKLIDDIISKGQAVILTATFEKQAKQCYNELLCVVSNTKLIDEFYFLALDKEQIITPIRLTQFKLLCRQELGLSIKNSKAIKQTINTTSKENETMLKQSLLNSKLKSTVSSIDALVGIPQPKKDEK